MSIVTALPVVLYDHIIRKALREDLGRAGDLTSDAIIPADSIVDAAIVAREFGCSAVTGAHGATTRIPHGVEVEVDPARGTVTIL